MAQAVSRRPLAARPLLNPRPVLVIFTVNKVALEQCFRPLLKSIPVNIFPWILRKGKVKCTLVQALRLCTGRTAHRGSRGIVLPFHDHDTRRGWRVRLTPRPLFIPGKDPVPIVQEAGWAPGPVWTGVENFSPIGIRSPDRPARSQSLYRLSYPAHMNATYSSSYTNFSYQKNKRTKPGNVPKSNAVL